VIALLPASQHATFVLGFSNTQIYLQKTSFSHVHAVSLKIRFIVFEFIQAKRVINQSLAEIILSDAFAQCPNIKLQGYDI